MSDALDPLTAAAIDAQQQADEARLRSDLARMSYLTGHFDEWLQSEFQRTKREYDVLIARREAAGAVGASPTGA